MKTSLVTKRGKIYIVITYQDEFGNIKKKWFGTGLDYSKANMKKAHTFEEEKLEEFRSNYKYLARQESKVLFSDFLEQWLERAKPNLQVSTYGTYQLQIGHIAKYFRDRKVKLIDLQPLDIANYYTYLRRQGKSVQLCEHYHVNIRRALQTALKAGLIPFNPADRIDRPRSPKHIASYYNKEQLETLFDCLENDRYAYIYKITAYYGLRRSEMMGIKWKNVDFEKNTLTLRHTLVQTRINGKSVIVAKDRMKNQSSFRTLPLLPNVKEMLLEEKQKQENNVILYGDQYEHKYNEYVCVDDLGYRINPDTVSAHFRLVLKQNNLPIIKFHELRHSCASLLLDFGVGMKDIQEWLGHSTYTTTADIYSHLDFASKKKVASLIDKMFEEEEVQDELQKEKYSSNEEFDKPKPRHLNSYKHRDNRTSKEIDNTQTSESLEKDIQELDELIKLKEKLLKEKMKKNELY